jgi:hypothetical protein
LWYKRKFVKLDIISLCVTLKASYSNTIFANFVCI